MTIPRPILLLILDGWGERAEPECNAILAAQTPNWDSLWQSSAHGFLDTSGRAVGLPDGQMGNSEVGHTNIGAGRIVYQDFTRVERAIEDRSFFDNRALCGAVDCALERGGTVHILGLLSPGGVHSHSRQIHAAATLARERGAQQIVVHAFLDGRDTPPRSARGDIKALEAHLVKLGSGRIGSICGRYYAMDRDQRWERVKSAYDALVHGRASFHANRAADLLDSAYLRGENDEFVQPGLIGEEGESSLICDGDAVIFMNFRADRARQLSLALADPEFSGFDRGEYPKLSAFCTLTQHLEGLKCTIAFPPHKLEQILGEYLSNQGLNQLRIAETEKYAHITFFFNGGREQPFPGEERILIPSPRVKTYDLQPEMSVVAVTDALVAAIESGHHDFIVCNIANPDMVGHTGVFSAAMRAVEAVDQALGRICSTLEMNGGALLLTADHGNIEMMCDPATGQAHTAHTTNLVPILLTDGRPIRATGSLRDIAPTILQLLRLPIPDEMTGSSLLCDQGELT